MPIFISRREKEQRDRPMRPFGDLAGPGRIDPLVWLARSCGWQTGTAGSAVGIHARGRGPGDSFSLRYFEVDDFRGGWLVDCLRTSPLARRSRHPSGWGL